MRTACNFKQLASVISAVPFLLFSLSEAAAQNLALPPSLPGAPPTLSIPTTPPSIPSAIPPAVSGAPAASAAPTAAAPTASAPTVRIVEENGIRYQETRQIVRQPVQDVRYEDRQQTGYQQRLRTDTQQVNYYAQVPKTQYECVPRLYDWWRVFRGGYVAYGLEPYTTWETQPQSTTVPVTRREVMPVTQTVKVAVPYLRFVEREQVSRVPLGPINPPAPSVVAAPAPQLTPSFTPPTFIPPSIQPPGPGPGAGFFQSQPVQPPIQPQPLFSRNLFDGGLFNGGLFNGGLFNGGLFNGGLFNGGLFGNLGTGAATGGSVVPVDSNPFGGFGVSTGLNSAATNGGLFAPAPSFRPPVVTPSPTPALGTTPISSVTAPLPFDDRYGGVARFDGDVPRFGAGSTFTR